MTGNSWLDVEYAEARRDPTAFAETFQRSAEAFRADLETAYARQLEREFLLGDGSPIPPRPPVTLRDRIRGYRFRARLAVVDRRRRIHGRFWLAPRERLALAIAPWLDRDDD